MRIRFKGRGNSLSPLASWVLLFLFVHAFFVSATHGYRFERVGVAKAQSEACVASREDLSRAHEAGGHSQCLLCRLQRNFVAELQKTSLPVGLPPQKTYTGELPAALSTLTRPFSIHAGRAPPLASIA